ncbi:MAG: DoxX family protein [Candidatus Hydrogenedentota bacterium]
MKVAYWICTVIIAWIMGAGGIYDLMKPPEAMEIFRRLGYPEYFPVMLGVAKVLGIVAILAPRKHMPAVLREWAYAGFTFNLLAASVSHAATGDTLFSVVFPLVLLILLLGSYRLGHKLACEASDVSMKNAGHGVATATGERNG